MKRFARTTRLVRAMALLSCALPAATAAAQEQACRADINGDGIVNTPDLTTLLAAWGECPPAPEACPSDLNEDGTVDFLDLRIILMEWGKVCRGACCLQDGACIVVTSPICNDVGGVYQGDDTDCENDPCEPPMGGCCLPDGTCDIRSQQDCEDAEGAYQGDDTDCEGVECPQPKGACCFDDGDCAVLSQAECLEQGGDHQGNFTDCVGTECPQPKGACCFEDGDCAVLFQEDCLANGGDPQGPGTDCTMVDCPQPKGACCFEDGDCAVLLQEVCLANGGNPQGPGTDCTVVDCPQPPGACCFDDGDCAVLTSEDCLANGGLPQGAFTTCADVECDDPPQACCFENGACLDLAVEVCIALDGIPQGPDTMCANVDCPQPPGACCLEDGSCVEVTEEACADLEGDFFGDFSDCAETDCPQPPGACCLIDGTCVEVTEEACDDLSGDFRGDFTLCAETFCPPPPGACCLEDGTCVEVSEEACADLLGDYFGDFSLCAETDCPQPPGACCLVDGTCVEVTQEECTGLMGDFQGDFTLCIDVDCPVLCEGVIGDRIWQDDNGDGCQDPGEDGIPNVRVTLFEDCGVPSFLDETFTDENGEYVFIGLCEGEYLIVIDESTVPDGFVETMVDACGDDTIDSDCVNGEICVILPDDFTEDLTNDCGFLPPPGACCLELEGLCIETSEADCVAQGGTYQGDFTTCADADCPVFGQDCCENGKPVILTMVYTGSDCSATDHSQDDGKVECEDFGPLPVTVRILSTNKDDPDAGDAKVWFDGEVSIGESFNISAFNADEDKLDSNSFIYVLDADDDTLLQAVEFHTSCSQPLETGDQFGASLLVSCLGEDEIFSCDGHIQELSMIWDGDIAVRIRAYEGDTNDDLLADIDFIAVGDEVTVGGYADSPNDVIWEVFMAGTDVKIGESKFHLSCSDDEMNGPEDCGMRQGNGKGNEDDLINDWLLSGLVDEVTVLDCDALPF